MPLAPTKASAQIQVQIYTNAYTPFESRAGGNWTLARLGPSRLAGISSKKSIGALTAGEARDPTRQLVQMATDCPPFKAATSEIFRDGLPSRKRLYMWSGTKAPRAQGLPTGVCCVVPSCSGHFSQGPYRVSVGRSLVTRGDRRGYPASAYFQALSYTHVRSSRGHS